VIVKPFHAQPQRDPRLAAGERAEKQMAHYLDRHFKNDARRLVLHDLHVVLEDDRAQIDHLVLHPFGAVIVESKSVSTSVRVNAADEWERAWKGRWTGMPDPILQGERQGILLKRLLESRNSELLDALAFGILQGTFRHMAIDVFAAISDGGTIRRARKGQAANALKADAVPDAIVRLIQRYRREASPFNPNLATLARAPRDFKDAELLRIAHFLRARDRTVIDETARTGARNGVHVPDAGAHAKTPVEPNASAPRAGTTEGAGSRLACKHCGSQDLKPLVGRYGPYGHCGDCGKNTSVRPRCSQCDTAVELTLTPDGFEGTCGACGARARVLLASAT